MKRTIFTLGIAMSAIVLSTLGIFASDIMQGIDGGFNLAGVGKTGVCAFGMTPVQGDGRIICVDMYEVSAADSCPHRQPKNVIESETNANSVECYAASVEGANPWTFVSLPQAQRICARAGKRLLTSDEWYDIALGTNSQSCHINGSAPATTGYLSECVSTHGVHDMIGNVWEWVDETIVDNQWHERSLPDDGYVASVDASGVAITTDVSPQDMYGNDYVWSDSQGVFGMIRGGFFGSDDDAGLYAVNASVPTDFASQGVGFRCAEDVIEQ
jgi:formylglycine-generating enzyme required for sulfatase activity